MDEVGKGDFVWVEDNDIDPEGDVVEMAVDVTLGGMYVEDDELERVTVAVPEEEIELEEVPVEVTVTVAVDELVVLLEEVD